MLIPTGPMQVDYVAMIMQNLGLIFDVLQTLVLFCCVFYGLFIFHRVSDRRKYSYLISAMACVVLGDMVSYLTLLFQAPATYGHSAAELAYCGLYIFLATTSLHLRKEWSTRRKLNNKKNYAWGHLAAVVTALLSILPLYVLWRKGASLMAELLFTALRIWLAWVCVYMLASAGERSRKYHLLVFFVFFADFCASIFSALGIFPLFLLFDFALTILFIFLIPTARGIKRRKHSRHEKENTEEKEETV